MVGAIFQIDLLGGSVAQHIRNVREVLRAPLRWVGSPKCLASRSQSQSGGYHTVFRGVKQVTLKNKRRIRELFHQIAGRTDKDATHPTEGCVPLRNTLRSELTIRSNTSERPEKQLGFLLRAYPSG